MAEDHNNIRTIYFFFSFTFFNTHEQIVKLTFTGITLMFYLPIIWLLIRYRLNALCKFISCGFSFFAPAALIIVIKFLDAGKFDSWHLKLALNCKSPQLTTTSQMPYQSLDSDLHTKVRISVQQEKKWNETRSQEIFCCYFFFVGGG